MELRRSFFSVGFRLLSAITDWGLVWRLGEGGARRTLIRELLHGLDVLFVLGGGAHHHRGKQSLAVCAQVTFYQEVYHGLHKWMAAVLYRHAEVRAENVEYVHKAHPIERVQPCDDIVSKKSDRRPGAETDRYDMEHSAMVSSVRRVKSSAGSIRCFGPNLEVSVHVKSFALFEKGSAQRVPLPFHNELRREVQHIGEHLADGRRTEGGHEKAVYQRQVNE